MQTIVAYNNYRNELYYEHESSYKTSKYYNSENPSLPTTRSLSTKKTSIPLQ